MDVEYNWEEEKGEIERFEEEVESSASGYSEKNTRGMKNYMKKEIMEFNYFGFTEGEEELRTIWGKIKKDMQEIGTGDVVDFSTDVFEEAARKLIDREVSKKEKRIEMTAAANIIRYVMSGLEDKANIEIDRRRMYSREYHRMKGLYISYRKKYETLTKRNIKEKGYRLI